MGRNLIDRILGHRAIMPGPVSRDTEWIRVISTARAHKRYFSADEQGSASIWTSRNLTKTRPSLKLIRGS